MVNFRAATAVARPGGDSYRPEIDGLRAIAVLAVIVHHFSLDALPSGFLGVDVFFVISGYVITASLVQRSSATFVDFLLDFYSRRVKRLLPALVLCVAVTAILISLVNPAPSKSLRTGITALFGFSNITLYQRATDYFAESTRLNAFTHTWSLGVEEQFYVVFPFLLWFTGAARRGERSLAVVAVLLVVSAASLAAFVHLAATDPNAAYFLMPWRFWELAAGALLWLGVPRFPVLERFLARLNPLVPLVGLLALFAAPFEAFALTTPVAVVLTALLIGSLRPGTAAWSGLAHRAAVHVGKISYSLYLWHWTVLVISRWTIGMHWWAVPLQLLAMWGAAEASYRWVEDPLRRARWSDRRGWTIARGLSATLATAAVIALMAGPLKGRLYTGQLPDMAVAGEMTLPLRAPFAAADGRSVWKGEPCVLSQPDQVGKRIDVGDCTLGDFEAAKRRILIAGNSIAAAFVPAFDRLVAEDGYAITITSAWGAPPLPSLPSTGVWNGVHRYYWDDAIPRLIGRLRPGDTVLIVSNLSAFAAGDPARDRGPLLKMERALEALSVDLRERGLRLAVIDALPFAHEAECEPLIAGKQWFAPLGGPCRYYSREETLRRRAGIDDVLSRLQRAGRIEVIDLFDIFCPGIDCTYFSASGELLYLDNAGHPSIPGARLSAEAIRKVLLDRQAPGSWPGPRSPGANGRPRSGRQRRPRGSDVRGATRGRCRALRPAST